MELIDAAEKYGLPRIPGEQAENDPAARAHHLPGHEHEGVEKLLKFHPQHRAEAHYAHLLKEDLVAASQQVKIPVAPRGTGNVVRMPRR